MNPLLELRQAGQSVWLDFLRRSLITGGSLERLVREDGVAGVTSNPTIFGKAIDASTDYDEAVRAIAERGGKSALEVFYDLALADIQMAADVFRPLHEETAGTDGFVSFELEPRLAHGARGSIRAATDLFERIGRRNVMIKVPGTAESAVAVEELTVLGVNVNITLLFSVDAYERVALAYMSGLERRLDAGEPVDTVASVASFFVSRIDTAVDALLPDRAPVRGKAAIANAKRAYRLFRRLAESDRWRRLAESGARPQRPLWASMGTKNPAYSDVMYLEELVGPDTVSTVPEATLEAFRDHGIVRPLAVHAGWDDAETTLAALPKYGVNLEQIAQGLLDDGLRAFEADLKKLLGVITGKLSAAGTTAHQPVASLQAGCADRGHRLPLQSG